MKCWGSVAEAWEWHVKVVCVRFRCERPRQRCEILIAIQGSNVTVATESWDHVRTPLQANKEKSWKLVSLYRAIAGVRCDSLAAHEIAGRAGSDYLPVPKCSLDSCLLDVRRLSVNVPHKTCRLLTGYTFYKPDADCCVIQRVMSMWMFWYHHYVISYEDQHLQQL